MTRRRAVLLSGWTDPHDTEPRHRNDLGPFYRAATEVHGLSDFDIRVNFCGGSDMGFTIEGTTMKVLPATRGEVTASLEWLAELSAGDSAFLVVANHGDEDGIALWPRAASLSPGEVEAILVRSAADKVLVFGQCDAGVFVNLRVPPAVIC